MKFVDAVVDLSKSLKPHLKTEEDLLTPEALFKHYPHPNHWQR